jgi:hypothetical protein
VKHLLAARQRSGSSILGMVDAVLWRGGHRWIYRF